MNFYELRDEHWEGHVQGCTYWIAEKALIEKDPFIIFGADPDGVVTIEARGSFSSYRQARKELSHPRYNFKGRMKKVYRKKSI
ncbi:hypothetical protein JF544_14250 [Halobacillus kuroshimensis]|uniref:Uncharacterized protein n=2 Tax=Halobacillus kuroshimensis TaxID=302481 RepID=A0ABS3DYI3_9BACI|nr:hypothetical protein [Halobacillus kuroshimensis]